MKRFFTGKWIAIWIAVLSLIGTALIVGFGVRQMVQDLYYDGGEIRVTELFQREKNKEGWGTVIGDAERKIFDTELKALKDVQKIGKKTDEAVEQYRENSAYTLQAYFTRRSPLTVFVPEEESAEIVLLWKKNLYTVRQPEFRQTLNRITGEELFPERGIDETASMREEYSAVSVPVSAEWDAAVTGEIPWIDGDGKQVVCWSKEAPDVQFYFGCVEEHDSGEIPWGYRKSNFELSNELYGEVYCWRTDNLVRYEYVLKSTPGDYTVQYAVAPEKDEAQKEVVLKLLQSVTFADGILSRDAACRIAEKECDFPIGNRADSFDVETGIWSIRLHHADRSLMRMVEVDNDGTVVRVKDEEK